MNDRELLSSFENCTLPASDFDHRHHVKAVWLYLQTSTLAETLQKFPAALKNYAKANGAENIYHETITFAYIFLINERIQRFENKLTWDEFVEKNPDLFNRYDNFLKKFYLEETLNSEFAKKFFVFPDRL
jgi:hypothetical protein